jgi:integrase
MNVDNLYHREFKPLLKKAGLSDFTFHSLRHTCATLLLSKNVNPKIVQEMLGTRGLGRRWTPIPTWCQGWGMLLPQR